MKPALFFCLSLLVAGASPLLLAGVAKLDGKLFLFSRVFSLANLFLIFQIYFVAQELFPTHLVWVFPWPGITAVIAQVVSGRYLPPVWIIVPGSYVLSIINLITIATG